MADAYESCTTYIAGEATATFYTCDGKYIRRMKKLMEQNPGEVQVVMDDPEFGLQVRVPKTWFKEPRPPAKRAPLTDEQRAAAAERLRAAREQKTGVSS